MRSSKARKGSQYDDMDWDDQPLTVVTEFKKIVQDFLPIRDSEEWKSVESDSPIALEDFDSAVNTAVAADTKKTNIDRVLPFMKVAIAIHKLRETNNDFADQYFKEFKDLFSAFFSSQGNWETLTDLNRAGCLEGINELASIVEKVFANPDDSELIEAIYDLSQSQGRALLMRLTNGDLVSLGHDWVSQVSKVYSRDTRPNLADNLFSKICDKIKGTNLLIRENKDFLELFAELAFQKMRNEFDAKSMSRLRSKKKEMLEYLVSEKPGFDIELRTFLDLLSFSYNLYAGLEELGMADQDAEDNQGSESGVEIEIKDEDKDEAANKFLRVIARQIYEEAQVEARSILASNSHEYKTAAARVIYGAALLFKDFREGAVTLTTDDLGTLIKCANELKDSRSHLLPWVLMGVGACLLLFSGVLPGTLAISGIIAKELLMPSIILGISSFAAGFAIRACQFFSGSLEQSVLNVAKSELQSRTAAPGSP